MATINFNVSEVAPAQEFQPLPEGKYEAVITDSDVRATRAGNGSYIQLEFEIVSGEYRGRRLWGRYNIENPNPDAVRIGRSQFAAVCRAVNIPAPRDTSELHNLSLILSVKCQKQRDSDDLENVIKGYESKTAAVAAPAPAVAAPAPAAQTAHPQITPQPQAVQQQAAQQPQAAQTPPWARTTRTLRSASPAQPVEPQA
jgi:hypothetical protein